mmetsp:Transcript_27257/g.31109  ORF Transcript_27257/g.31109 Transcript_27257/m.31109 type:complete len:202 (+) Transcript_27257:32-637(+)
MQHNSNSTTNNAVVTLHVYEFQPDSSQHPPEAITTTDRALLMFSQILPAIGMGAYHTSLEVMNLRYTFAGGAGVMVGRATEPDSGIPGGARYSSSIKLGVLARTTDLSEIVKRLSLLFFTPASYHLVHRNCNHFTETLATALILTHMELLPPNENNITRLTTFPKWLNRLANTGAMVISAPEEGTTSPCDTFQEARIAAGY